MFAVGGSLAVRAQDGTFNDQDKKSDVKHSKAKNKSNDNAGRRKHWYSPPHWFHKKHDKEASKSKTNPFDKPGASGTKVAGTDSKAATSNTKTTVKPAGKAVATTNSNVKTGGTASTKTVAAHPGTKTSTTARRHRKTVRKDCTPEQAKKGGCTVDKAHSQKGSANPS